MAAGRGAKKVRIAQVGLGRIGAFHAESLATRIPEAELAFVVDTDRARAERFGERFTVPWAASFQDVLADPSVEAVVIATPTPAHADMLEAAAAAGKHIFCEKPVSLDQARGEEAVATAERAGVKLQIGFHRRFDPDFRAVKAAIDEGEIGEVRFFRATCRDMHPPSVEFLKACGGIFADVMLHDFDDARWLVGEITELHAMGAVLSDVARVAGDVDNAVVALRFASGALGLIDNSRESGYGYDVSLEVMGSRSTMRIGQAAQRVTSVERLADASSSMDVSTDFVTRFASAYVGGLAAFVRAVIDGAAPSPSGGDATAAFALALAARRSMDTMQPVRMTPAPST